MNSLVVGYTNGDKKEPIRLPVGFRFRPTDGELIVHYLKRRALSLPLPVAIIPDFDVFRSDPWAMPGDSKESDRYFFCKMGQQGSGGARCTQHCSAISTTTGSGFWKVIGKPVPILGPVKFSCNNNSSSSQQQVVGTRTLWAFYQEKHSPHGWLRSNWFIHEFQLLKNPGGGGGGEDCWVACKVFQEKRKQQKKKLVASCACPPVPITDDCRLLGVEMPTYIDFKKLGEEEGSELGPPIAEEPSSPPASLFN